MTRSVLPGAAPYKPSPDKNAAIDRDTAARTSSTTAYWFNQFGRKPEVGDRIRSRRYVLRADAIDDERIEQIVIQPPEHSRKKSAEE